MQQRRPGRGVRLDLAERHLPDGGDGPLQVPRLSPQLGAVPLLQQVGVVGERRPRLLAVGRRLLERQRQVAERVRDPVGGAVVRFPAALAQEPDRLLPRPPIERQRLGDAAPRRIARGDEDVPGRRPRERFANHLGVLGIVVDEKPAAVPLQPPPHRRDDDGLLARILLGQVEGAGERDAIAGEQGRIFRPQPPAHVVVVLEAVGVFARQLRLADAAEPVDSRRLRQRGGRAGGQVAVQPLDQLLPPGEVRVAMRQVPDRRQGAGEAGFLEDFATARWRCRTGKRRLAGGLGPFTLNAREQPIPCGVSCHRCRGGRCR